MKELEKIHKLVGQISKKQLRYVDCFMGRDIGLFMPAGGACFYKKYKVTPTDYQRRMS